MVKKILVLISLYLLTSIFILSKPLEEIVKSNNKMAVKLLTLIEEKNGGENIFISPFSINSAISITLLGAKGETKEEMLKALEISENEANYHKDFSKIINEVEKSSTKETIFKNGNRLWVEKDFHLLKKFVDKVNEFYKGGISSVDFKNNLKSAIEEINNWVMEKTANNIKDLLRESDLDNSTRLVITNAVYFKGTWEKEFKEENTLSDIFHLESGEEKDIKMMFNKGHYLYGENEKWQILGMKYRGNNFIMFIILPKKGKKVMDISKEIAKNGLSNSINSLSHENVEVYIPKFKFEKRYYLKNYLMKMGIKKAFSSNADFSGITGKKDLFIDKVIHQAKIEVNEKGSEAAAATAISMKLTSAAPIFNEKRIIFKADHPFIFFIIHKNTGEIIFEGVFNKP